MTHGNGRPLDKSGQNVTTPDHSTASELRCATPESSCPLSVPLCGSGWCSTAGIAQPTGSAPAAHRRPRRSLPNNARPSEQARKAVAQRWSATARRDEAFRILWALDLTPADRAELISLLCSGGAR